MSVIMALAVAAQAQKISPKMQKGMEKVYTTTATTNAPSQKSVKMTYDTKYTVTDATADGYVVDVVITNFSSDAAANDIAGQMVNATVETMKDVKVSVQTDKDGQAQKIKNYAEVKQQVDTAIDVLVDKLFSLAPQLAQMMKKEGMKQQIQENFSEETLMKGLKESVNVMMLNGRTPMTGAQEEYVSERNMKMKRMYFVSDKNIVTNASADMSKDELKAMIIAEVEKSMPEQADMVKQNIDQLISSGMLKMDMKETATFMLEDDNWVQSIHGEMTLDAMGQQTTVKTETVCK
jgi:hypothetical protein